MPCAIVGSPNWCGIFLFAIPQFQDSNDAANQAGSFILEFECIFSSSASFHFLLHITMESINCTRIIILASFSLEFILKIVPFFCRLYSRVKRLLLSSLPAKFLQATATAFRLPLPQLAKARLIHPFKKHLFTFRIFRTVLPT